MEKILTVKNLVMKFSNHAVLKNIDFDIEKGEKVFIIGPSGCGKSTLLRCLNHLIKPTRGDITFEGHDLKKTDINLIRTKLGLVFQSFNLFPHLTVLENISGGQKQRVAIIRTLIMEPNLIMFDEPTSALDPKMTKEVKSLIQEVAETGITMLIVSHEMEFVKSLATRVIFMQDGKIIEEGSPNEIFKNPKTKELQEFLNN